VNVCFRDRWITRPTVKLGRRRASDGEPSHRVEFQETLYQAGQRSRPAMHFIRRRPGPRRRVDVRLTLRGFIANDHRFPWTRPERSRAGDPLGMAENKG
jgi:hypothetical protein